MAAYYSAMAAFYFAMAAFYSAMAAFYITMAAFYINMAALLYIEHSWKLCSPKVSSPVFWLTRADPPIFPRCFHLTMASMIDQPASKKDKLATIRKNQPHSKKAKLDTITTRKEHCRFSMEETEGAVITSTLAMQECGPAPDKLAPRYDGPGHPRPVWLLCHGAHLCHARVLDPVQNTVPSPATLHSLAKVPTMEDLHSFGCLTPKEHCRFSKEKTEGERKKERKNEWPRQFPAWLIYPAQAVTCSVLVYS